MPVLEYYEQMGMVSKIDGSQPVEEVWAGSQARHLTHTPTSDPRPALNPNPNPYPSP